MRSLIIIGVGLLLMVASFSSCDKNPAGIDLEEEADFIPWELVTGKIAYRYATYDSDQTLRSTEIIILDGNSQTVTSFAKEDSLTFGQLAWSENEEKIIFSALVPTGGIRRNQLFELNTTTGERRQIYRSDQHSGFPAWSADGKLAYTGFWFGIWIEGELFYSQDTNRTAPTWSPDGNYLVASIGDTTSQGALYKISLEDTTAVALIQGEGAYNDEAFFDPKYSPDGSKIAYVKISPDRNIYGEIWLMNPDGTGQLQLTSGYSDLHPEWSPDGNRILFQRESQLVIMNKDGSNQMRVTKSGTPFLPMYPEWIP